ncbi:MAG: chemotaxis protein CheX [Bryobacteraceae bacterium]
MDIHELLIEEIRSATLNVLSTMLGLDAEPGAASMSRVETGPSHGVAAMVGVAGPYSGSGSVVCTEPVACRMAGAMLMAEYTEVNDDVLDAMGEIANMVIGNIKTNLEERFGAMALTTPTVIHGGDFSTRASGKHTWTVTPFTMEGAEFFVQMMLVESPTRVSCGPGIPVALAHH